MIFQPFTFVYFRFCGAGGIRDTFIIHYILDYYKVINRYGVNLV